MNEPRYEELLGRVLDGEINSAESDELRQGLRQEPERLRDLQVHLVLWELFSQQRRPERGAEAFVSAWRTRLAAESDAGTFLARTMQQIDAVEPEKLIARAPGGPVLIAKREGLGAAKWPFQGFLALLIEASKGRWAARLAVACCLVLITGFGFWLFGPTVGEPVLLEVQGKALSLERAGQMAAVQAGTRLQAGDRLLVHENATATISFAPEKTSITLMPGTELKLVSTSPAKRFSLLAGKLQASVAHQRPFRPMVLATPQAEARVLGTRFALAVTTNGTRLEVTQGKVRFTRASDAARVQVAAGNYAVAAANYELLAQPFTGSILREHWTNLPGPVRNYEGLFAAHPQLIDHPDGHENLKEFEFRSNGGKASYVAILRGYVHPPGTGKYTFWIVAGEGAQMYLSPDDKPENRQAIATANMTAPHDWTHEPSQQSPAITMVAGRKYYLEVQQRQAAQTNDHLAVAWQGPGRDREVIPGEFLSPFVPKYLKKR